jgi:hypothetical protein
MIVRKQKYEIRKDSGDIDDFVDDYVSIYNSAL